MQPQEKPARPPNKLRNLALKLLLSHIDKSIDNYSNSLSSTLATLSEQPQQSPTHGNPPLSQIEIQLGFLIYELTNCPRIWLRMLRGNQMANEGNRIVVNSVETITEVYEEIMEGIDQRVMGKGEGEGKGQFNFEEQYCDDTVRNLLAMILNYIAEQIVLNFQQTKSFIIEQTQLIEQLIKKSQIMNTYILFGLLKQMSKWSHAEAKRLFQSSFPGIEAAITEEFCRYVQGNFQLVHLHYTSDCEHRILTKDEQQKILHARNLSLLQMLLEEAVKLDKDEEEKKKEAAELQEKMKELAKQSQMADPKKKKKWKFGDLKDSFSGIFKVFKKNIEGEITADTSQVIQSDLMTMSVPQSASLGGSLGKCLVDIDNYKSINQFFAQLSKTAMIGGSIAILLEQIPIFNYFIIAGGLSYTVYRTYNDQISSSLKKMKYLGKASIVAVGSVGSTVTGMMIGEVVIPVPILGAFVGGVIGGYVGEKGSRELTAILNDKSFVKLISYLQIKVIDNQRWEYSTEMLQKLGISQKYFDESFCPLPQHRDTTTTCICFFVVAHYESRKQIEYTQNKLKQQAQKNKKQSSLKDKIKKQKDKIKDVIINEQEFFKSEFDVIAILEYLSRSQVYLVGELKRYEPVVKHLIN